jgi:serine/threonine-protein kinase RsbW
MISSGLSVSLRNNKRDRVSKIVIKVPSEIKYLRQVSSEILKSLAPYKLDEAVLYDIRLCVEEAVRNAMVHGNRSDKALTVEITYGVEKGRLNIEVEDRGRGFDHSKVADPTRAENMLKYGGRGVYLIRRLMDLAEYNDAGNKIKMVKVIKR